MTKWRPIFLIACHRQEPNSTEQLIHWIMVPPVGLSLMICKWERPNLSGNRSQFKRGAINQSAETKSKNDMKKLKKKKEKDNS